MVNAFQKKNVVKTYINKGKNKRIFLRGYMQTFCVIGTCR